MQGGQNHQGIGRFLVKTATHLPEAISTAHDQVVDEVGTILVAPKNVDGVEDAFVIEFDNAQRVAFALRG